MTFIAIQDPFVPRGNFQVLTLIVTEYLKKWRKDNGVKMPEKYCDQNN